MKKQFVTPEDIITIVSDEFKITPKMMFLETRKRAVVEPRQVALYLIKTHLSMTLEKIGNIALNYGRKTPLDHATVLHAYKAINSLYETEVETKIKIEWLENRIQNKILENKEKIDYHKKYIEYQNLTKKVIKSLTEKKRKAIQDYQKARQELYNIKNIEVVI